LETRGLLPLHVSQDDDGVWRATFETNQQHAEPEPNIAAFLAVIDSLDPALRSTWHQCASREFNIGYDFGPEPWAFNQHVSSEILRRMGGAGVSLRITLYPAAGSHGP